MDDREIFRALVAQGVQATMAARLVEFVPMVYCRLMLTPSGARFPSTYRRKLADGQVSKELPLESESVWKAAKAFAGEELERGVSAQNVLAVAGRSAEFDALNQLLNNGSNLANVALTSVLLNWPESGPEAEPRRSNRTAI